ncbi:2-amino-4-hydroxy-6-hydroxymethyldihydropteridinediphosphokinase [Candidatus Magnetomoraceae bacterium gMMP-15]
MPHIAYMAVGSNIGQKLNNCINGIKNLINNTGSVLKAHSDFYKTEPLYVEDQDWFVNGVFKIKTNLDPFELLDQAKAVERDAGRDFKTIRFGPRILDLDILFFDDLVINTNKLILPHPKIHERRFVLQPICDIEPDLVHPVLNKTMSQLFINLKDSEKMVIQHNEIYYNLRDDLSCVQAIQSMDDFQHQEIHSKHPAKFYERD